ncbi:hypothetical protein TNCT_559851 [Trichonephila clavata]|uniref:Uncharacterized protein n=1 Tax=Trichonephila clavata TaxID=2740835 RepID=A0A8X6I0B0_TRICU|nr:hypothetical protein TNCT_559851 [Trichonephila clavata]
MKADEDLKILTRIRSKERMKATRKRRKEEQVKQSDSDSENESKIEESPPPSHQASKSPAEACRKTGGTVCAAVLEKYFRAGLYVLVQLHSKSGKKNYLISLC